MDYFTREFAGEQGLHLDYGGWFGVLDIGSQGRRLK